MGWLVISCEMYDYIEIVCLFKYPIEIHLKSGDIITGIGQDTKRNSKRQECILVNVFDNVVDNPKKQSSQLVVLDGIVQLSVLQNNPHFQTISFS